MQALAYNEHCPEVSEEALWTEPDKSQNHVQAEEQQKQNLH